MGQLLVIQDEGEIDASLSADHSVVRAAGIEALRRAISTQTFHSAIVFRKDPTETAAVLGALREADADLAVVLVMASPDKLERDALEEQVWEIVPRPLTRELLRSALRRASQQTRLSRENRTLRAQIAHGPDVEREAQPHNGNGANEVHLHWIASLPARLNLRELLSSLEKGVIQRTLETTRGAQAEAARRLGLSRSDLSYKLAKYELRKPTVVRSN
jgi:DNA-binding NtrC family response regulator